MAVILYPTVLGTGFLPLPHLTAQFANNDLWISVLLSVFAGLIVVYMATKLHDRYPNKSVVQYSEQILGLVPGKLVGLIYIVFTLHTTGVIVREYAEFIKGNFLFRTPLLLIMMFMLVLCAFAVRGGIEVIARSAVIFTPIFILPLLILIMLYSDLDFKNIFPVLSHGMIPVLKGALTPQAWVSELFLMSFLLPSVADPAKGRKWGFISLSIVVMTLLYVNLMSLFLLGVDTSNKMYPILIAFRYISIGNIFENLEALLLGMWFLGNFMKISVFYYVSTLSLGQWLKLSDYRPVVFPIGILIVVLSLWDLPDFPTLSLYLKGIIPFFIPAVLIFIPLVLLIVALLRNHRTAGEGESYE